MKELERKGKSCFLLAVGAIGAAGALTSVLVGLATESLRLALVWFGLVVGGSVCVVLFFCLPVCLYAFGKYFGGRMAGMDLWHMSAGPFYAIKYRSGERKVQLAWSWAADTVCVMVPTSLDRPERQCKFCGRGAIYGSVAAVLLYALLAFGWYALVQQPLVFAIAVLPLVPIFSLCHRESQRVDQAISHKNHALYYLALGLAQFEEWSQVRPRDWKPSIVETLDHPLHDDYLRYSLLGYAFAYWNDMADASRLRSIRDELALSIDLKGVTPDWKRFVRDLVTYYSVVYEHDLQSARSYLEGDHHTNDEHVVGWRNATVLAVLTLLGREEEARALADKMIKSAQGSRYLEYVEEHVERVISLKAGTAP